MTAFDSSNKAAPGVSFYTPDQTPPSGTAEGPAATVPAPFRPLDMRSVHLANRIVVSPMCEYSAAGWGSQIGQMTDYHFAHLSQYALRGAGLIFTEVMSTEARGRISPQDLGIWDDAQIAPMKRIFDFLHSQGAKAGVQIGHAGRKASTLAPWIGGSVSKTIADESVGGWSSVVGPSEIKWAEDYPTVRALSTQEVKDQVQAFVAAARRAVAAGVDVIEIHGAHGYLISAFLSPLSNNRTDDYGGSFENRTRFLREVIGAVRALVPETMPIWVRVSATEWMEWSPEPSWTVDETIRLAKQLPSLGVDVLDISSGGNSAGQKIPRGPEHKLVHLAATKKIRAALKADGVNLMLATVGGYSEPQEVLATLDDASEGGSAADLVLMARQFLREPEWVFRAAHELGVQVKWPHQYHRAVPRLTSKF